jgi:hypothetical protein
MLPSKTTAQSSDFKPYFTFGTNQGISFSSINFYPNVVQQQLMGYYGGVSAGYISEKHWGLLAELNYSQRGWKEKNDAGYYERHLNYVEMPFLTHFYAGKGFRWILNFGPKIGYLMSEATKTNLTDLSTNKEFTLPVTHKFDYGICVGSGFELYSKAMSYTLEARYSYGLGDIFDNSKADPFGSSGNTFLSVTLGISLHFQR